MFGEGIKRNFKILLQTKLNKMWYILNCCSISDVHLESSGGSGTSSAGRDTKSSLSVESGGSSGRGGGGLNWTPPAGSADGSTPTWTEGTPSFTESSSSGDMGKCISALYLYFWAYNYTGFDIWFSRFLPR